MRFDSLVIWVLLLWVLLFQRERKLKLAGKSQRSKLRLLIAAIAGWFIWVFGLAGLSILLLTATGDALPKQGLMFGLIAVPVLGAAGLIWWLAMRRKAG